MTQTCDTSWSTVEVDGAAVRVMTTRPLRNGSTEPLLFLHGWGLSPQTYADGIRRLAAAGITVLAPALPGFSGSDGPPLRGTDLRAYAHRIGRLLDVLEIDTPVFVVGHSFGGGVALQLATDRPERVRSLTLVNSVGGGPGQRTGLIHASWLRWALGAVAELRPRSLARSTPSMLRAMVPNLLRNPMTLALTAKLSLTADLVEEAKALVAGGLPVLFIWGDEDKVILPGALSEVEGSLAAEIVHGRHGWLLTEPEAFSTLLRNALTVHALLERRQRGQSTRFPKGASLADLLPPERRKIRRVPEAALSGHGA